MTHDLISAGAYVRTCGPRGAVQYAYQLDFGQKQQVIPLICKVRKGWESAEKTLKGLGNCS